MQDLNKFWESLSPDEKLCLFQHHQSLKPKNDYFSEIFQTIQPFHESLLDFLSLKDCYHLKQTSKTISNSFPSLVKMAIKQKLFSAMVKRLIQLSNGQFKIECRYVFDEKCRYVNICDFTNEHTICSICKLTGMILTWDKHVRGTIYDENPLQFFTPQFTLCYHNDLTKNQKLKIKNELEPIFKKATIDFKKMNTQQKKRKFSQVWNESDERLRQANK